MNLSKDIMKYGYLWPESVEYPFRGGFRSRDKRDIVFSGLFVFLPRRVDSVGSVQR